MPRLFLVFLGAAVVAVSCSDGSDRVLLGPSPVVAPPTVELVGLDLDSSRPRGVVPVGDVFEIVPRARYRVGNAQHVVPRWTLRPSQLLELVHPSGTFRAVAPGAVHVSAAYADPRVPSHAEVSASLDVEVSRDAVVPRARRVNGWSRDDPQTVEIGGELRLRAVLEYSDGSEEESVPARWTSNNQTVASVTAGGLVAGRAAGGFHVTAAVGALRATAGPFRVVALTVPSGNAAPRVTLRCAPCSVSFLGQVRLVADVEDPDQDPVELDWSAPLGAFTVPERRSVVWVAPEQLGSVPITVVVTDAHGARARARVTVEVERSASPGPPADAPPVREFGSCEALRDAGWHRGARAGGTYRPSWDTAEQAVYAYNRERLDAAERGSVCLRTG